jgi:BirA family biotin operon repressor/biotin-[acetyl-CoA-carboxylase] ligase
MHLPLSTNVSPLMTWTASVGSTNVALRERAARDPALETPDFTVLATDNQTAGRGRLDRTWVAPAGASLAVSVLLRPQTPSGRPLEMAAFAWYPLLAGLAMTRACASVLAVPSVATLKWPNDVLVNHKKVSGILTELVSTSTGPAVIIGAGVNLTLRADQLPTATSTSLALAGLSASTAVSHNEGQAENLLDSVLAAYLSELRRLTSVFAAAEGDAESSGLRAQVSSACDTLGRSVRVELPSGKSLVGAAIGLDKQGCLCVDLGTDAPALVVAAGDVTHLRVIMEHAQPD